MRTTLIKTSIWEEDSFFNLNMDSKLLFMYLLSSPARGLTSVFKFSQRLAVAYTGLSSDQIDICLNQLQSNSMVELYIKDRSVKYVKLNDKSYVSPKKGRFTEVSLKRELLDIPEEVMEFFNIGERADRELLDNIKQYRYEMKLKSFRNNVFKQKGNKCIVCGENDISKITIDHIIPLSRGGDNNIDNLQILCVSCNSKKGMESSRIAPEHKDIDNNKDKDISKAIEKNNELLNEFKEANEYWEKISGRTMSDNPTSRNKFKLIRKEHSMNDIKIAINGACYFQGKEYKPQVLSFASMHEKWDSLQGHMQSHMNNPKQTGGTY